MIPLIRSLVLLCWVIGSTVSTSLPAASSASRALEHLALDPVSILPFHPHAASALAARQSGPHIRGFNVGDKNPDGSCKSPQDWSNAFSDLAKLPGGGFHSVRLFGASECNTLGNAVPAGIQAGVKFLVGIWSADDGNFEAEKAAVVLAIQRYGTSWISAISVGNEDLYRKAIDPSVLAQRILSVQTLLRGSSVSLPTSIPIGHADTWTAWQDGANAAVVRACEFIGHQGYPYWEGRPVDEGSDAFWTNLDKTVKGVAAASTAGAPPPIWITETGWPVSGPSAGNSIASVSNAQQFWKQVGCVMVQNWNVYWYAYQDYTSSPSFGVYNQNRQTLYDMSC